MASTFILTDVGRSYLAANGADKLVSYKLAVGGGTTEDPIHTAVPTMTSQSSIQYTGDYTAVSMDPGDTSIVYYRILLDESVGDFQFTQVGMYNDQNELCAVANSIPIKKYKTDGEKQGDTREILLPIPVENAPSTAPIEVSDDARNLPFYHKMDPITQNKRVGNDTQFGTGQATDTISTLTVGENDKVIFLNGDYAPGSNMIWNADGLIVRMQGKAARIDLTTQTLTISGSNYDIDINIIGDTTQVISSGSGRLVINGEDRQVVTNTTNIAALTGTVSSNYTTLSNLISTKRNKEYQVLRASDISVADGIPKAVCLSQRQWILIEAANSWIDLDESSTEHPTQIVTEDSYFLYKNLGAGDATDLSKVIQDALNAGTATNTYTVSYSKSTRKITISANAAFSILWSTGTHSGSNLGNALQFDTASDDTGGQSYEASGDLKSSPQVQFHASMDLTDASKVNLSRNFTGFDDIGGTIGTLGSIKDWQEIQFPVGTFP